MADVLSQSEIDELLLALASGADLPSADEEAEEQLSVRVYDFRTANKFTKDQIRMLHLIYANYAGRLSTFLTGVLRTKCDVEVTSIEEQTFAEFSNSLPSPAYLAIFSMPPLKGSALFEISSSIAYEIVSRLLGGTATIDEDAGKPFTDIEISILSRIGNQMLSIMSESWDRVAPMQANIERVETSPQFAQIVVSSEPIAIVTISVTIGSVSDIINLCIPHLSIQPIAKKLSTTLMYNDRTSLPHDDQLSDKVSLSPHIAVTPITLRAMFDPTTATINDILNLQVGDVIRVEHPTSRPITIMVEHIPKFKGGMGLKGRQVAIRVSHIIKEVSDDD